MKISKTYKINESTRDAIQNLSATEDLSQGDVIDRAVLLLKLQTTLNRGNKLYDIKVIPKQTAISDEKLRAVKAGGFIILELVFNNNTLPFYCELQVNSCDGIYGKAKFIGIRKNEIMKTFESFDKYIGKTIDFNLVDIWDYTDKLHD